MSVSVDVLNRLLHDTVNSVVQYAEISAPYIPAGFDEEAALISSVSDEEKILANEVVALIIERDGVPKVGVFPYWNVDLNYLDIRFMAKFAVGEQQKAIGRVEGELPLVQDDPEVHGFLRRALELKKSQLERLTQVSGDYGES